MLTIINKEDVLFQDSEEIADLFLNNKVSRYALSFIGALTPFIHEDDNSVVINNQNLTFEELAKFIGYGRNTITKVIGELKDLSIIYVESYSKKHIIYFNPKYYFCSSVSLDTYKLFNSKQDDIDKDDKNSEKELELYLIDNINLIEHGMTLIKNQYKIEDGYIDILAKDNNGTTCIIELKVVHDDKSLVFQSVYYPTQFDEPTRMITIAPLYTNKIAMSLKSLGYVEMKTYRFEDEHLVIEDF